MDVDICWQRTGLFLGLKLSTAVTDDKDNDAKTQAVPNKTNVPHAVTKETSRCVRGMLRSTLVKLTSHSVCTVKQGVKHCQIKCVLHGKCINVHRV